MKSFFKLWIGWFAACLFIFVAIGSLIQFLSWLIGTKYGAFISILFLLLIASALIAYIIGKNEKEEK
jgi:hypothetical protein